MNLFSCKTVSNTLPTMSQMNHTNSNLEFFESLKKHFNPVLSSSEITVVSITAWWLEPEPADDTLSSLQLCPAPAPVVGAAGAVTTGTWDTCPALASDNGGMAR